MKSQNFRTSIIAVVARPSANAEFSVSHGLSTLPADAFVIGSNAGATLYKSGTAWTATTAYLKADTANASFLVLFFV